MSHPAVPSSSRGEFFFALLCSATLALLVVVHFKPDTFAFTQDLATTFAAVRAYLAGELLLLGPPSHLGGRHLGPVYYWIIAGGMLGARGDTLQALLYSAVFNTVLGSLTVFLAFRYVLPAKLRWPAIFGAFLTLAAEPYRAVLRDPWHANLLLVPSALFILAAFLTIRTGPSALPLFALAATLLVQLHFASVPMIAGVGVVVATSLLLRTTAEPIPPLPRRVQFLGLAVTGLLWVFPLLYEVFYPSNILALLHGQRSSAEPPLGLKTALSGTAKFLLFRSFSGECLRQPSHLGFAAALLLSTGGCALAFDLYRRASRNEKLSFLTLLATVPLYPVIVATLPNPFYDYYLNSLLPLPPIIVGCLCASASRFLCDSQPWSFRNVRKVSAGVLLATLLLIVLTGIISSWDHRTRHAAPPWLTYATTAAIADAINTDNRDQKAVELLAKGEAQLIRESVLFLLPGRYEHTFTHAHHFLDLARFSSAKNPPHAQELRRYYLFCPTTDWKTRRRAANEILKEWRRVPIALKQCHTCRSCDLWRLEELGNASERTPTNPH